MSSFQVIRVEKLKSGGRVQGRLNHAMRKDVPQWADSDKQAQNGFVLPDKNGDFFGSRGNTKTTPDQRIDIAMGRFKEVLPEKYRKNAVLGLEFVVTASPEIMAKLTPDQQTDYLRHSMDFLVNKFGGKENVVAAAIHRDETTPHLSMFMVPKVNGRLSCKHYIDGPKDLAKMQTEFHDQVSSHFGMDRGRHHSPAKHMDVKKYYSLTNEVAKEINLQNEQKRTQWREEKGISF